MSQSFGQRGEQLAADYLKQHGYVIVETNWRCRYGEIDVIARQDETLVFVEVRARHSALTEAAFASISRGKQQRLLRAVHLYLATHQPECEAWRVDVIAVAIPLSGTPVIDHVTDGLDW